ncbi:MAG: ABC transporter ATP-binding protein [Candidatus Celaenobacter antarcticus]|nr:ABC transporter ATP-binding protein [Candidatus Celaenobacter antarcticus]
MIKVENLYYSYSDKPVLDDISFTVDRNDFVGVIGPNGAGKSTLLKCLCGYIKDYQGDVYLNNIQLSDYSSLERARQVSVVVQQPHFEFDFTVRDVVLMGKYPYLGFWQNYTSGQIVKTEQILKDLNIGHLSNRYLAELSGGEFQLIMIARALNQDTDILLFDEPASHLDIHHQIRIFSLLQQQNLKQNKTIFAVSHNINLAAEFCNKILILDNSRIIAFGKTDEVLKKKALRKVFQVPIEVIKNPFTGKPNILYNYTENGELDD